MRRYKYFQIITLTIGLASLTACTKLNQKLNSTLTSDEASNSFNAALFLQSAYIDVGTPGLTWATSSLSKR